MNIPANVQKYISSLPPNEQKAAMNEIMQSQYNAYKNSPNQVNQQNMQQPIAPKVEQELRLPSKVTQPNQAIQEDGNLERQLQEMLMAYFEKMQFTEQQAKMFMQEFAKLSDEEKQQMIQELQEELQGSVDTEPQSPPEEDMPTEPESMRSGGMMKKKSKCKTKRQTGGKQVVQIDEDYYEVDARDGKINFDSKKLLDNTKKQEMSQQYVFNKEVNENPVVANTPVLDYNNNFVPTTKAANTKPKQAAVTNSADKDAILQLQKSINSLYKLDIKEDGMIGPETRGAIANLGISNAQRQAIYNQFPQLKTNITKSTPTTSKSKSATTNKVAPDDTSAQTKPQAIVTNSKGVKAPSAITLKDGTTVTAPTKKVGQSAESWDETIDRWQDYLTGLETAGVVFTIGAGATGIGLPVVPFIAGATKAIGTLTGLSNVLQGAYHYYNDDDYTKANRDMSEGAVQFLAPRVLTQGLKQVGKYGTMAAKSPAVQKIFAEVKPNILKTAAKNEPKPVLKALPAGKIKPVQTINILPSSGETIITPVRSTTPAKVYKQLPPAKVNKQLPPNSQPIPKLLHAGKAPVNPYKELFDFKTVEKTDWNDIGLFDYTRKGISATKKATNPKNLLPSKPKVQTTKKVVVKPAPVNNNIPAGWEISPGKLDRNGNPVLRQIRKRQFGGNLYNWY